MRLIGIFLIIAGLYYGVARPWLGQATTEKELTQTVVFDKQKIDGQNLGWQVANVLLEQKFNTAHIRIDLWYLPGTNLKDSNLKLLVRVAPINQDGEIEEAELNQSVVINLGSENANSDTSDGVRLITALTNKFNISRTGQYKIGAFPISADNVTFGKPDLKIDSSIIRIDAVVITGSGATGSFDQLFGSPLSGGVLVIFGIIVLSFFKRRKTKRGTASISPKKSAKSAKPASAKTIRWGRDAGKKR